MPRWMQHVAAGNPVNWALEAGRAALGAAPDWAFIAVHGGWLVALAVVMIGLSTLSFRSYQKSL